MKSSTKPFISHRALREYRTSEACKCDFIDIQRQSAPSDKAVPGKAQRESEQAIFVGTQNRFARTWSLLLKKKKN